MFSKKLSNVTVVLALFFWFSDSHFVLHRAVKIVLKEFSISSQYGLSKSTPTGLSLSPL